jgi:hypothetical protein
MGDNPDQYPIRPRDPKHSGFQILKIPVVLSIYAVPAVIKATGWSLPTEVLWFCLLFPPLWLVGGVIHHSDTLNDIGFYQRKIRGRELDTIIGLPQSGKWAPEQNPVEPPTRIQYKQDPDLDTLRVEYQSLVSEAQYRDKLLLRTTYFALGAIALFAGILSTNTPSKAIPAIAMLASIVMLAFAIAANSYKDSRDALWDRIGRLENTVPELQGYLTTFNTVRAMDLRLLNTVSLSSYSVGLIIFITAVTYALYFWSVLFMSMNGTL